MLVVADDVDSQAFHTVPPSKAAFADEAARFYGLPASRTPLFGLRLARTLRPGERVDSR